MENFSMNKASAPYAGLVGSTPPVGLLQPLGPNVQQPLPNQPQGQAGTTQPPAPVMTGSALGVTAARSQRGYNNTPVKAVSQTPGATGRPPLSRSKTSNAMMGYGSGMNNSMTMPIPRITGPMAGLGSAAIGAAPPMMGSPMSMTSSMGGMSGMMGRRPSSVTTKLANYPGCGAMKPKKPVKPKKPAIVKKAGLPINDDSGETRNVSEIVEYIKNHPNEMHALAALGNTGGGAIAGAGIGGLLGSAAGASRGNVSEGLGRGVVRGGMTGAGMGAGGYGGALLGEQLGNHPTIGGALGSLAGGLGGYALSGKMLGEPAGKGHKEKEEEHY